MIYLGGKWAANRKSDRSSACRRPTVGKKLVKREFCTPSTFECKKMTVFEKNLRFAKDLSEIWGLFLRFVEKWLIR